MYYDNNIRCFDISTACNFGAKSSGYIWEEYGQALEFILRWSLPIDTVLRYVDDFITISRPKKGTTSADYASSLRSRIDAVAKFLGVSLDKFEFGTSLEFLGVTVDTDNLCFRVPPS